MQTNIGNLNRLIRVVVGLVLIGLTLAGAIGIWGWIGVVPLVTGAVGWCPAFRLLGIHGSAAKKA